MPKCSGVSIFLVETQLVVFGRVPALKKRLGWQSKSKSGRADYYRLDKTILALERVFQ